MTGVLDEVEDDVEVGASTAKSPAIVVDDAGVLAVVVADVILRAVVAVVGLRVVDGDGAVIIGAAVAGGALLGLTVNEPVLSPL